MVPGASVWGLTDSLSEYDSGAFAGMHDVWWHLWCVSSVGAPIYTLCCIFSCSSPVEHACRRWTKRTWDASGLSHGRAAMTVGGNERLESKARSGEFYIGVTGKVVSHQSQRVVGKVDSTLR